MRKKLLVATALIVPSLAVGGLWIYQANLFEKSITQQLTSAQESLKDYGVSFQYDALRVSKYAFKAHLVNPTIAGTVPKPTESLKNLIDPKILEALQGLKGTILIKGEMSACFSPLANAVTINTEGDSQLDVEGPLELKIVAPKPPKSSFVIQRKDYDLFGKNPFLSLNNIKRISSDSKGISIFLNDQKLLDLKHSFGEISLNWNDKAIDVSVNSNTQQMQFFKIEKGIRGKLEGIDALNAAIGSELAKRAILGPQDQKISASFHVNDLMTYISDLKLIYADSSNKANPQVLEKLVPEGFLLDIKNYSTENNVYQSSMKGSFGRLNGYFPVKLSGDFKVTNQWTSYWDTSFKSIIDNVTEAKPSEEIMTILKKDDISKVCMPQLQAFGKMLFSMDFEIPETLSFTEGKGSLEFKSDLYDLAVVGALTNEGGSVKLKTRNATSLTTDLESYITRVSQPFSELNLLELQSVKGFVKGGRIVLDKILEPSGVSEQSVNIHLNKEGIKVGKYDLIQIMNLFGEAMGTSASQNDQVVLN